MTGFFCGDWRFSYAGKSGPEVLGHYITITKDEYFANNASPVINRTKLSVKIALDSRFFSP
jgi:hypothetical protein